MKVCFGSNFCDASWFILSQTSMVDDINSVWYNHIIPIPVLLWKIIYAFIKWCVTTHYHLILYPIIQYYMTLFRHSVVRVKLKSMEAVGKRRSRVWIRLGHLWIKFLKIIIFYQKLHKTKIYNMYAGIIFFWYRLLLSYLHKPQKKTQTILLYLWFHRLPSANIGMIHMPLKPKK